jgi:hypothetical protein
MKRCMIALLIMVGLAFCAEPMGSTTFWNNNQMEPILKLIRTMPQKTTPITVTGAVGVDTITSSVRLPAYAVLTGVYITVTDSVESRGDSLFLDVWVGANKVCSQYSSAFDGYNNGTYKTFYFAPTVINTPNAGGDIIYGIKQAAGSGAEGMRAGTFKINLGYFYP